MLRTYYAPFLSFSKQPCGTLTDVAGDGLRVCFQGNLGLGTVNAAQGDREVPRVQDLKLGDGLSVLHKFKNQPRSEVGAIICAFRW